MHIPPRLVKALRAQGFEAIHVQELGLETADDKAIWECAKDRGAAIITKDSDFMQMGLTGPGPYVILVCLGNCSNRVLIEKLFAMLPTILNHFEAGACLVELG